MTRLVCVLLLMLSPVTRAADRPNVVFIVCDDLANTLGCYNFPAAKTPTIDRLATEGVTFDRAYCQFPHCNPSRASFLSGRRPSTTRVTNNADDLYQNLPGIVTLPHHFRKNGYATARCGKVFHLGVPTGLESMDDPQAWDFGTPFKDERPYPPSRNTKIPIKDGTGRTGFPWQETLGQEGDLPDEQFAAAAIQWLENRDPTKPFFLAVGFHRPHVPFVAPAACFDRHPLSAITLPIEPDDDEADIPLPARNGAVPGYAVTTTPESRRAAIRAYLACVSHVDDQTARVLDAVRRLGLMDKTIVIFTSDHGWHLGEHGLWHKRSVFEECARVPLIIRAPGVTPASQRSRSLVELLDLYPTLCDLCGVPPPAGLEGKSLRPVLTDPKVSIHEAAFTLARRGKDAEFWGRSIRTDRWRCTEWNEGRDGLELYDHDADPHEYTNLASDPKHAAVLADLRARLAAAIPTPFAP